MILMSNPDTQFLPIFQQTNVSAPVRAYWLRFAYLPCVDRSTPFFF